MGSPAESASALPSPTRVLVTGGSRGIGFESAARLRSAGAEVVIVARSATELEEAARRIGARAIPADVADPASVAELMRDVRRIWSEDAPDILVNAAGAFALAPLAATSPEEFQRHLAVNLLGPFLMIRACLPGMLARGRGHVVTLGSVAGRRAFPHNGAYSASKFGVRGLHAVLSEEVRGTGVRATLIEPSATDTDLWDAVDAEANPGIPLRSAMLPAAAVADAVVYAVTRPPEVDVRVLAIDRS